MTDPVLVHADTNSAAAKPLVLVHANWQARPFVMLLQKTPAVARSVEIRLVDDHEPLDHILVSNALDRVHVVAVWQQVTTYWDKLQWGMPAHLPKGAELVRFPYLEGRCFWPLAGSDPRNVPEDLYPEGRYLFSDRCAAALADTAGSDDVLYERYLALSATEPAHLDAALIADLAMMATRDALCDIRFTLFFLERFRHTKLLHAPASPTGTSYQWLAMQLAERLAPRLGDDPAAVAAAVARQAHGLEGIAQHQFPVHPQVAAHLGLLWATPDGGYRFGNYLWSHREAILRSVHWLDWTP